MRTISAVYPSTVIATEHLFIVVPYNGNSSRKKMFANFANLRVFVNIFLLNFHFLVLFIRAQR